jgi:putative SOS response-associated peptidase YedK
MQEKKHHLNKEEGKMVLLDQGRKLRLYQTDDVEASKDAFRPRTKTPSANRPRTETPTQIGQIIGNKRKHNHTVPAANLLRKQINKGRQERHKTHWSHRSTQQDGQKTDSKPGLGRRSNHSTLCKELQERRCCVLAGGFYHLTTAQSNSRRLTHHGND